MKTIEQIKDILSSHGLVDCHVHTHVCDGHSEMTVENIARQAEARGFGCIVLTPHFHKQVSDPSETLYQNSDESIFLTLREEIEHYEKTDGKIKFLLSAEADILSLDGKNALDISTTAEHALDIVTVTFNYHPLLPLKFVKLTYGKYINQLHQNGEYLNAAVGCGGVERVLKTMYQTQANAIEQCQYPMMLGHFFMDHSVHPDTYNCFGAMPHHLPLMKEGARMVIQACKKKDAIIDLTGVHLRQDEPVAERIALNDFLVDFQCFVLRQCIETQVPFYFGSDAHSLRSIGASHAYYEYISRSVNINF